MSFAQFKQANSNLARCYLALRAKVARLERERDSIAALSLKRRDALSEEQVSRLEWAKEVDSEIAEWARKCKQAGATIERLTRIVAAADAELTRVDSLLAQGKGTWPEPGYVRDETWARWEGQQSALQYVMRAARAGEGKV